MAAAETELEPGPLGHAEFMATITTCLTLLYQMGDQSPGSPQSLLPSYLKVKFVKRLLNSAASRNVSDRNQ